MAAESHVLSVIRVWAAVAWADGTLAAAEATGLRTLIATADLTDAERQSALAFLDARVGLPPRYLADFEPELRRGIYRTACQMATIDHVFAKTERAMLDKLRWSLELSHDDALAIEAAVPGVVSAR